ncbi:hypothetical protein SEA_FORZA_90 [Gordonia phage Forza]|uniref:NodB homology domain-containing protein n=1 Tax=Gordonia phage Forza TaxID=2571247 RepID=A0A650EYC4_9CAUD|nr:minor tail protein [Gordonia phage Forza]QEM41557.1 hypothetical protein SEA_BOOPY_90 [Gordonia phage Boopy]QGT55083.1 hypothetical protein SEA_FORZA_90 [Gordonia phage Forza]UXE04231.1 minor tail protein [Gordonia phage BlueNGold]WBF03871.1 hypothetical protein SEA_MAREELIH_88 [Gordonia phage Mareelih]
MVYNKQTWVNGDSSRPINASRLNHIEAGIEEVSKTSAPLGQGDVARFGSLDTRTVTNFEAGHGFTVQSAGGGTSNLNDTGDFVFGTQSVRLTTAGAGASVIVQKSGITPIADGRMYRIWIKVDTPDTLARIRIFLSDSSAFTNYYSFESVFSSAGIPETKRPFKSGEWVPIALPWSIATVTGSPLARSALTNIRILINDRGSGAATVRLGRLETFPDPVALYPNGVVSFTYDDSFLSHYTVARAHLDKYGYPGVLFPIIDRLGTAGPTGYLTQFQVDTLAFSSGWEIGAHATSYDTHVQSVTGMTSIQRRAEFAALRSWQQQRGYTASSFAFPNGETNAETELDLRKYYGIGRLALGRFSAGGADELQNPSLPTRMYAQNCGNLSLAQIQAEIDRAKANKAWLILVFHDLPVTKITDNDFSAANHAALVDYVAASGIAVATLDQVRRATLVDKTVLDKNYAPTVDGVVPAQNLPAVFRTTDSQPFAANSIWNTPIGLSSTFETQASAATASFLAATPAINDTLNGYGFYNNIARPTDPLCTATYTSNGTTYTFKFRCPYDPVISTGTDLSMRVIDGGRAIDLWKTVKTGLYSFTADFITETDLTGSGRNAGTRAARFPTAGGLIRAHELGKCYIPHALCISIPGTSLKRGFVWPAAAEDAVGVTYSGEVPMGSFFAIPSSVDINSLGLSQEGLALAKCLQDYGMYVGDQSGSAAISVDGEAAVSMRAALERMRTDWTTTIFQQLRRVTNVGTTPGGPGTRKVAPAGPVGIRADYQETLIDVLTTRLRSQGGAFLSSEDAKTPVDPIVSTNAALGGKTLNWTGWPAQYRIATGAIRRIASPDGQTRILLVNPGVRDVRLGFTVVNMHPSGFAYAVVAATDSSNHYRLAITSGGAMHIQKVIGGTVTGLTPATANGTIAAGKYVEVMIYGPIITVIVDGEVVAEAYDTENLAGTQCGIYFPSDATIGWTNLRLYSVPRLFRKPRVES